MACSELSRWHRLALSVASSFLRCVCLLSQLCNTSCSCTGCTATDSKPCTGAQRMRRRQVRPKGCGVKPNVVQVHGLILRLQDLSLFLLEPCQAGTVSEAEEEEGRTAGISVVDFGKLPFSTGSYHRLQLPCHRQQATSGPRLRAGLNGC